MRTYKNSGKEELSMRRAFLLNLVFLFFVVCPVQADTIWESGHHEINDGDVYGEIWMYNDCTLDIWGGDIYRLAAHDATVTNWYDGTMITLWVNNNSIVNIYGGSLGKLAAIDNGLIYLYAYDVMHTTTGGYYGFGQVMGKFYSDDSAFYFDLMTPETYQHIHIVPEPISAIIDIQPDTLNISSKGKWLTCHIYLPEDYNVADVNSYSISLMFPEDEIYADWLWFNEKQNVVSAKFNRSYVQEVLADSEDVLETGQAELTITGQLLDGTIFEGTDTIKVINKGRKKK